MININHIIFQSDLSKKLLFKYNQKLEKHTEYFNYVHYNKILTLNYIRNHKRSPFFNHKLTFSEFTLKSKN